MGYRVPPWSEEMPRQMIYQADPRLAEQYQRMGEEQYAREVNQQEKNTEATRDVLARQQRGMDALNEGAVRGVSNFVETREKAADRQMRQASFEREGRQSEESMATMQQQRELAGKEEQRRAERAPLEKRGLEAQAAGAEAETKGKVQAQAFADAPSTAEGAKPGESNAQYEARTKIETAGYNAQTARQQLAVQEKQIQLQEQQLAQAKDMAPMEKQRLQADIEASRANVAAARRQIADLDRAQATKDATNVIQAEMSNTMGDPNARNKRVQAAVAQLKSGGATPAVIAEAINNANASESQKAFMAKQIDMMDPQKQAQVATLVQGHQEATLYKKTLADLQTSYQEYKASANLPDAKGDAARQKFQQALRDVGENALADDLESSVGGLSDFVPKALGGSGGSAIGREGRMKEAMATVRKRFADQLNVLGSQDPRFTQYAKGIAETPIGDPSGTQVATKYVTGGPQQSMANGQMSVQPASVGGLQGLPGVKIRPQVGNK